MVLYAVSPVFHEERTLDPGAETSGFTAPARVGPRLEKEEITSSTVVDPTPITPAVESPGELADPQDGPELPMAKTGMIPAVCQELMMELYQVSP